jgi:hypothetical protein
MCVDVWMCVWPIYISLDHKRHPTLCFVSFHNIMAFRKLDVDSIEENAFQESDFLPPGLIPEYTPEEAQAIADQTYSEVRSLLQQ